jgi:hypothetical protein
MGYCFMELLLGIYMGFLSYVMYTQKKILFAMLFAFVTGLSIGLAFSILIEETL